MDRLADQRWRRGRTVPRQSLGWRGRITQKLKRLPCHNYTLNIHSF